MLVFVLCLSHIWSHILERKFRDILRYFSEDINATVASRLSQINRSSVNKIYLEIRNHIVKYCDEANSVFEVGEIELDESYFGGKMKGKQGRASMVFLYLKTK